jgi:hypothetical protein
LTLLPIFSNLKTGNKQQATGAHVLGVSTGSGNSNAQITGNNSAGNSTSAHQHDRPTALRVSGRAAFSTPSILGALSDNPIHKDRLPLNTIGKYQTDSASETKPLTQEKLTEVWKLFVEKIEAPQLKSALSSREPKLTDQKRIEYFLDNELQLQRLTLDLKPKLLGHLRNEFGIESIEINFYISSGTDEKPSVPYTESEKWQALVEKYPALATLKTKFGLDFEQ